MGWFSSRQRRKRESAGKIYAGPHRSPGFEVVCGFLETEPAYTILDLGPSSTENLEFLSELCDDLVVQDVFHSSVTNTGARSEIFRFDSAKSVSLPNPAQKFDVILIWDLLHYLVPEDRAPFIRRLAERCAPNAMVLITASSIAEIPPEPIQFKALRRDRLEYCLGDERAKSPGMNTRVVEQLMTGFVPVRNFQLRNGLQEMIFQIPEPPSSGEAKESEASRESGPGSNPESVKSAEAEKAETPDGSGSSSPGRSGDGRSEGGSEGNRGSSSKTSSQGSQDSQQPQEAQDSEVAQDSQGARDSQGAQGSKASKGSRRSRRSRRRHSKR